MEQPVVAITVSTLTCPRCGHQHPERMPECSCVIAFTCRECGAELHPVGDDCCVFCSYGSAPCPVIQQARAGQ